MLIARMGWWWLLLYCRVACLILMINIYCNLLWRLSRYLSDLSREPIRMSDGYCILTGWFGAERAAIIDFCSTGSPEMGFLGKNIRGVDLFVSVGNTFSYTTSPASGMLNMDLTSLWQLHHIANLILRPYNYFSHPSTLLVCPQLKMWIINGIFDIYGKPCL